MQRLRDFLTRTVSKLQPETQMIDRPTSPPSNPNSERPLNFAGRHHLRFSVEMEALMLALEQRHVSEKCASFERRRVSDVSPIAKDQFEPCAFDDFGLVQGLEIDARWM